MLEVILCWVIALSIGLSTLNDDRLVQICKLAQLLPCLSGFLLLTPTLKRRINNHFLMPFAWQKIIHYQPPSLHHQNHLLIAILPYAWQNAKILFNSPLFLLSDFLYRFLTFHKSVQALFLTSCNPNKILITKTALHQLSVLCHPLIKQRPPRLLFSYLENCSIYRALFS